MLPGLEQLRTRKMPANMAPGGQGDLRDDASVLGSCRRPVRQVQVGKKWMPRQMKQTEDLLGNSHGELRKNGGRRGGAGAETVMQT